MGNNLLFWGDRFFNDTSERIFSIYFFLFVEKLVEYKVLTEETGKNIYEEFFSGKYNHDKIFSAQDSLKLGLNIEIVENMPRVINDVIIDLID